MSPEFLLYASRQAEQTGIFALSFSKISLGTPSISIQLYF